MAPLPISFILEIEAGKLGKSSLKQKQNHPNTDGLELINSNKICVEIYLCKIAYTYQIGLLCTVQYVYSRW